MLGKKGVEQHIGNIGIVVFFFQKIHVATREILRPVKLAHLIPVPRSAADAVLDNAIVRTGVNAPLVGFAVCPHAGKVRIVHVFRKGIEGEVVVG